jgi:hypothetical protein
MITATKGFIAYKLSDYYVQPPSLVYDKIFEILGSTITAGRSQLVFLGHAAGLARTLQFLLLSFPDVPVSSQAVFACHCSFAVDF